MKAFAPASIGNFAAGFDVLGAAVAPLNGHLWGDTVEVQPGQDGITLSIEGPFASVVPSGVKDNLVGQCATLFMDSLRASGGIPKAVHLVLDKGLPICSGLGSSASSVVATLVALNAYFENPFLARELLSLAGQGEALVSGAAHLDNVAPSLLGGLRLVDRLGVAHRLPFFNQWRLAVVHPELTVSTSAGRRCLPEQIPLGAAVKYWQNLSAFVDALHRGDEALAAECIVDDLIEVARRDLVHGFQAVKSVAMAEGAVGCSLSGSGPSVFAVTRSALQADVVFNAMKSEFARHGVPSSGFVCTIDDEGARLV